MFDYACAECTALCCRGQGFNANESGELRPLLKLYPSLGLASMGRKGQAMSFATPTGHCFFLATDESHCRIEREHGKSLKPSVCRDFPFNSFSRVGETLVVRPHFLCPLRLTVPARPGAVEGSHERLESSLRETGSLTATLTPSPLHATEDALLVLDRERKLRLLCEQGLGQHSYGEMLVEASTDPVALTAFIQRCVALLRIDQGHDLPSTLTDDLLLALAPSLSISALRLPAEGRLRYLALAEVALRHLFQLNPATLTPQSASNMLGQLSPSLRLLARDDEPMWQPSEVGQRAPQAPGFDHPASVLAALVADRATKGGAGTMDALEAAVTDDMDLSERSSLFVGLGVMVEERDKAGTDDGRTGASG